jgi:hypothetical protein
MEKLCLDYAMSGALSRSPNGTVARKSLVPHTSPPVPICAVICVVVGLSVRRASPRDDILEVGKIVAVEDNYSGRHTATDPSDQAWSPSPLFSVHPRHHRSDGITVTVERGKLL